MAADRCGHPSSSIRTRCSGASRRDGLAYPEDLNIAHRQRVSTGVKTKTLLAVALALAGGIGWLLASFRPAPTFEPRELRKSFHFERIAFASGDVIFRRGRSLVSRAVLSADGGSEYSHVGLVSVRGNHVWIIHSVPAEPAEPRSGVIVEPIQAFLAPERASAAAIYRSRNPQAALRAEREAWGFARAQIPFDDAFDLSTPNALYCTELVWRAFLASGLDLRGGTPSTPAQVKNERYLLPSRLEKSPDLLLIQELTEENRFP